MIGVIISANDRMRRGKLSTQAGLVLFPRPRNHDSLSTISRCPTPLVVFLLALLFAVYGCERIPPQKKAPVAAESTGMDHQETRLAAIPKEYEQWRNIAFSADGRKVFYKGKKKAEEFMVAASTSGEKTSLGYENISWLIMSPDGRRCAFGGGKSGKERLVIDTKELTELYHHDVVAPNSFSPDGRFVAVEVGNDKEKEWFITLIDGEKEVYRSQVFPDSFRRPHFSADGRLMVYELGSDKDKEENQKRTLFFLDVNARKIIKKRMYADCRIGNLSFSSDSSRVIYDMQKQGKCFLVLQDFALNVERTAELPYIKADNFLLSPDGKQILYVATKDEKQYLVVSPWESPAQGTLKGPYEAIGSSVFGPDSKKAIYQAVKDGKWRKVVGDKEGAAYDGIGESSAFSPDGAKMAYPAMKGTGGGAQESMMGGKWFMAISPVGKPEAAVEGPVYDMVVTPVFSPDNRRIAYRARKGSMEKARRFIVIADAETGKVRKEGPIGEEIWPPVWSVDSKVVGYGAKNGRELWWKVEKLP